MAKAKSAKKRTAEKRSRENVLLFIMPAVLLTAAVLIISIVSTAFDLQKGMNFWILAVLIGICSFLSGFLSGKAKRQKGIFTGIIYPLPSFLLFVLLSLILNRFSFDFNLLISSVIMLLASASGGVTGVNIKKKIKRGKR